MISPEDIHQQAIKWWKPFLQSIISSEPFFPKEIDRIGKIRPGDVTGRLDVLQDEIAALYKRSKNETGRGYWIKIAEKNFRRTGSHQLPDSIVFETAEDYLHFVRKGAEYERFLDNYRMITQSLPQLQAWAMQNIISLTSSEVDWKSILAVCAYFISHPRPDLYIRQLPIAVHTKFIEENSPLLQSLLDFLIPDHIRDPHQKRLADRYFLRRDEPLIRLRMLDRSLAFPNNIMDISIRLSDFEKGKWQNRHVVITENKMNFLALPDIPFTIAIWSGGGFMVSYLRDTQWLRDKNIFYWGDIDEHGFQILHQLRTYYRQTQSIMMDRPTYELFKEFAVAGERNKAESLSLLDAEEHRLYDTLKSMPGSNRLEQEKIPQAYSDALIVQKIAKYESAQ
jgi:hypothetical protein